MGRRQKGDELLADFFLQYQPIYRLDSMRLLGAEALLRHPRGAGPLDLLEAARRRGAIPIWELAVLERAAGEALAGRTGVERLFFNLTPEAYGCGEFVDGVGQVLARVGASSARLCIEVSEKVVYSERAYRRWAERWRGMGCQIALDDFGRGGSNVALVAAEPPDFAKIDGSLARGLAHDRRRRVTLEALVSILLEHGVFPIVEGVEFYDDLQWLREAFRAVGAQGFALARPGPLAACTPACEIVSDGDERREKCGDSGG